MYDFEFPLKVIMQILTKKLFFFEHHSPVTMAATGMKGWYSMEAQSRTFRLKNKMSLSFQTLCNQKSGSSMKRSISHLVKQYLGMFSILHEQLLILLPRCWMTLCLMSFKNAVHYQRFNTGYNRYQTTASLMLVLPGDLIL